MSLIAFPLMDSALALALLAGLAWIVGETRARFFPAPNRWKWALGWVLAALIAYPAW